MTDDVISSLLYENMLKSSYHLMGAIQEKQKIGAPITQEEADFANSFGAYSIEFMKSIEAQEQKEGNPTNFKRKVTWVGEDWGFYLIEDHTDHANDLKKVEGFTDEQVLNFFRPGEFTPNEVETNNGNHFLYGADESIGQSDHCPPQLYEKKVLKYIVEVVE